MSILESRLNMTLARLRVIEEALHGHHEWSFRLTGEGVTWELSAKVQEFADGVRFVTTIPAEVAYWLVELRMDGDTVQVWFGGNRYDHPHVYIWELTVENPLTVG